MHSGGCPNLSTINVIALNCALEGECLAFGVITAEQSELESKHLKNAYIFPLVRLNL